MKQKDKFYSSLLVALVAGFIYYQFADIETIKNLPQLAYKMFTATVEPQSSTTIALNALESTIKLNKDNVLKVTETDKNIITELDKKADFIMRIADQSTPLSSIFRHNQGLNINIPDFAPKVYALQRDLPEHLEVLQDFGVNMDFGENYVNLASFGDNFMHDSNKVNFIVKLNKLDSINIYIDMAMDKLNESIEKLNIELAEKDFLKIEPKIDQKDLDVEIDMSEFNKSMKEFEENMKDFKFDMKDFEKGMKELHKNMDGLKENMKELRKNELKNFKIKVEEVES